jgi:hypothetical protein
MRVTRAHRTRPCYEDGAGSTNGSVRSLDSRAIGKALTVTDNVANAVVTRAVLQRCSTSAGTPTPEPELASAPRGCPQTRGAPSRPATGDGPTTHTSSGSPEAISVLLGALLPTPTAGQTSPPVRSLHHGGHHAYAGPLGASVPETSRRREAPRLGATPVRRGAPPLGQTGHGHRLSTVLQPVNGGRKRWLRAVEGKATTPGHPLRMTSSRSQAAHRRASGKWLNRK